MSALDITVYKREDGKIVMHSENDGWTYMNRGPEEQIRILDPNDPHDQKLIERHLR